MSPLLAEAQGQGAETLESAPRHRQKVRASLACPLDIETTNL